MSERAGRLGAAMVAQLPALRRYALGLTGQHASADDLVQDCIERALRRLASLEDEDRIGAWLRTILFNAFVDDRRQLRHRVETVETEFLETLPDLGHDPRRRLELQQVLRVASTLTPQHRQVLLLVGVEGLSYREVAEEIGVPVGTVMSRLARARDQLRVALDTGARQAGAAATG